MTQMPKKETCYMLKETAYVAIRKNPTGDEWINVSTLSLVQEQATQKARDTDSSIPLFGAQYPVVRIAKVEITEI